MYKSGKIKSMKCFPLKLNNSQFVNFSTQILFKMCVDTCKIIKTMSTSLLNNSRFFFNDGLTLSGPGSENQSWAQGGGVKNAPPLILVYGDSDPVENLGT